LVKVLNVTKADISFESKAIRSGRGETTEDTIAIDRLSTPRPRIFIDVVVFDYKQNKTLADSFGSLSNYC
jgi:hypothetical protein